MISFYTCCICDDRIEKINDGILRWCSCKALGIDCDRTGLYIRILGIVPKEDEGFAKFYEAKRDIIETAKANYQNKIKHQRE